MKINIKRDEMIIENIAAIFYTLSSKRFLPFFINSFMLFPLLSRSCRYHLDLLSHPPKLNAARPRSLCSDLPFMEDHKTITHLFQPNPVRGYSSKSIFLLLSHRPITESNLQLQQGSNPKRVHRQYKDLDPLHRRK